MYRKIGATTAAQKTKQRKSQGRLRHFYVCQKTSTQETQPQVKNSTICARNLNKSSKRMRTKYFCYITKKDHIYLLG